MEVVCRIADMHRRAEELRIHGKKIALVPTMGYLHNGHVSLMQIARDHADVVIVSLFVNPLQFGPHEDYARYPRDWDRDIAIMNSAGVDMVFAPSVEEMYPNGFQTTVTVSRLTKTLCGLSRPGHFEGVTTVVAKLFLCTKPHVAVFGEKDFQQLVVIRRMVHDLGFDIQIIPAPIVRESDGLAMSSRNTYLNPAERQAARCLSQSLFAAQKLFEEGQRNAATLIECARARIEAEPLARIDYIKICDATTLDEVTTITRDAVMPLAVYIGKARLIDNVVLRLP
ncbi:MAG: pantoate--beta-alanine ligase [Desulfobacterota bacterium]|nr:pantoate--beta-alanine ligase [Thermodesulfobacteriota bacterium]